ncbi:hypothetical protein ADK41_15440 [Streptomyces caelestis]|uniref:Uncharacterized protein n=2 Tax=Streptomyces TaxID=1883 RepID=A0A0N0S5V4_9ACTN|nr:MULTISPECIES: hypothetical protein [Streptomyces]KOT38869.1 hypothetical protein ADK41_15440 [Streptomyces caelestis]KOV21335.1 hypothetical protein ADK58_31985 [Streptomyces sp. XY152]
MGAVWRWGVGIWTAVVIVGGGLTLWLQDEAEPPSPARWERTEPDPTPVLPEGWETRCPVPEPSPGAEDGLVAIACRVTTD